MALSIFRRCVSLLAVAALFGAALPASPAGHVVSPLELRKQIEQKQSSRDGHVEALQGLLSNETAQKTLRSAGFDGKQVLEAVPMLDDESLERLAQRAASVEQDVAAGALNNQQITYILIALATAVIVLILVN